LHESGSPWIPLLSREIVNLQQQQVIAKIYKKWWVDMAGTKCTDDEEEDAVNSNALGVRYIIIAYFVLAAILSAIFDFCN